MKLIVALLLVCAQAAFAAVGPSGGGTVIPGGSTNLALLNATNSFTGPLQLTGITAARVPIIDAGGNLTNSAVTPTTLGYLDATSSVQTQLDSKPTVSLTNVALLNASANGFAGKVGAGVTSPSDVLHISAPTATLSARLHNTTSGNSVYWQAFDASTMEFYYGNSGGWLQLRAPLTRVVGTDSSVVPFAVKSAESQAVNVQEWQTNTGAVIAAVTSSGALRLGDAGGNPATVSNGAFVFGKDVAGTVEVFVMDEAGNVTQISPHARASSPAPKQLDAGDKTPIVIHHANLFTGEQEWLHLSAMAKDMERITGRRYIYKAKIADAEKREWEAEQKKVEGLRVAERSADAKRVDVWRRGQGDSKEPEPKVRPNYVPKPKPEFLR